jgi:hypothetical protein
MEYTEAFAQVVKEYHFDAEDIPPEFTKVNRGSEYLYKSPDLTFSTSKDYTWFRYKGEKYLTKKELQYMLGHKVIEREYTIGRKKK